MSSEQDLLRPAHRPALSVAKLVDAAEVEVIAGPAGQSPADAVIHGLSVSTFSLELGDVFVAVPGLKVHGARYALQAIEAGAAAILTDASGVELLAELGVIDRAQSEQEWHAPVPVLQTAPNEDVRSVMAHCASVLYSNPSLPLAVSAVTGTNGKTTTSFFLDAIHRAAGERTALLGTVEMRLGESSVPSTRTTVESPVLQGFLARCVEEQIDHVTMEVSSHALSLHRVTATGFGTVGFTNLQHDHLDFHHTMEEYFEAKASLFTPEFAQMAVVIADDAWGRKLASRALIPTVSITTQLCDDPSFAADWRVVEVAVATHGRGVDFVLNGPNGVSVRSYSPLLGDVNVSNAALATVMALCDGVAPSDILTGLTALAVVPGRMEVVSNAGEPLVIVDYAHTAEALEYALSSLHTRHENSAEGKLIVVFGAAGDRDATKRPHMGEVAFQHSHVAIITDDDPYSESPSSIRDQVLQGVFGLNEYRELSAQQQALRVRNIAPREDAMEIAIKIARPQDTVLIAGRGHETIQDLNGEQHILDDREFARRVLDEQRKANDL